MDDFRPVHEPTTRHRTAGTRAEMVLLERTLTSAANTFENRCRKPRAGTPIDVAVHAGLAILCIRHNIAKETAIFVVKAKREDPGY